MIKKSNITMNETKTDLEQRNTVESFVKTKDKLLTAFSVFLALTIFTSESGSSSMNSSLSFVFMTLTVIVWFELWASFPSKNRSWTLVAFENLISISTILLLYFWLVEYFEKGKLFIYLWIAAGIATIGAKLIEKYGLTDRLKRSKVWQFKVVRYLIGLFFIVVTIILTLGLAALIMGGLNPLVESLKGK